MKRLPVRKNIRRKDYDYSRNNAYFITICVEDKHEMLGKIAGTIPPVQLSRYGRMVMNYIVEINNHYKHIYIDKYVVMPNHVHLLIVVHGEASVLNRGTSGTPSPTNAVVPSFVSTLKRFVHKECGFSLFQRSYHDRIIRDMDEYRMISQYIDKNPSNWMDDCYYPKD